MGIKKAALIFLGVINVVSIAAGIYTQVTFLFNRDFVSVLPISEMGTQEILYVNFLCIFVVITLINIVVAALLNDGSYSAADVFKSCPLIALAPSVILFFFAIYTSMGATSVSERVICLLIAAFYVLANAVNFGCMAVIKDSE